MIVEITNTETKQTVSVEADGSDVEALKEQFKLNFSAAEFRRIIDNLDIPAEAKALLTELLNFSICVIRSTLDTSSGNYWTPNPVFIGHSIRK